MAEPRRSGRRRNANPKYANDGWDKEVLRKLRESSTSSGSSPADDASEAQDERILDSSPPLDDEQDDDSMVSVASARSSDVKTPDEDAEDMSLASDDDSTEPPQKFRLFMTGTSETARSRGIQYPRDLGKAVAYRRMFGPSVDDLSDVLRARDTWLKGRDITMPSRQAMATAIKKPGEANEISVEVGQGAQAEMQDSVPSISSSDSLNSDQVLTTIRDGEAYEKYLLSNKPSHSIVLGPWEGQKKYVLDYLSSLDFGKAWQKVDEPQKGKIAEIEEDTVGDRYHEGWFVNVGEKVQCLAWAPCSSPVQYLAVAVRCTSKQRHAATAAKCEPSAFRPSAPYPSAIQIWAFQTKDSSAQDVNTLSMDRPPMLVSVLATEWGSIRNLKWSPSDQAAGNESQANGNDDSGFITAFLGVISSDGHARLVAVPLPLKAQEGVPTKTLRVEWPALDVQPPADTLFTTLSFASPTDLLLGTADGCVHMYDLSEQRPQDEEPKSYMHQQLHHTYIVSLCSASPGPHATLVASASASGDLALTDLRSPIQDRVTIPRTCFPNRDLVYMPFTRSFVAVLDRSGNGQIERNAATFLVCHHIRQFPTTLKLAKLPHQRGAATALAGSKWHPCLLVGNAKGQVLATNYLRRILPFGRTDHNKAMGAYLQKICEYDWRPLTKAELDKNLSSQANGNSHEEEIDLFHGRNVRPGMSRFYEGFKPEKIEVGTFQPSSRKVKNRHNGDVSSGEAVFEEEQAVTAIDWSPNAACAGFVAVGWGSGIVRVQDLAYDSGEG